MSLGVDAAACPLIGGMSIQVLQKFFEARKLEAGLH